MNGNLQNLSLPYAHLLSKHFIENRRNCENILNVFVEIMIHIVVLLYLLFRRIVEKIERCFIIHDATATVPVRL